MTFRITVLAGVAAGLCSLLYFLSLAVGAGPYPPLALSALGSVALAWWCGPLEKRWRQGGAIDDATPLLSLRIVFFVVLAASAAAFLFVALKEPQGEWDAWSIWNLHARFMARGGTAWTAMFSKELAWSYPDYPLLLPALVAQAWSAARTESLFVPMAIAFLFTFGTVAALLGVVRELRGWEQALLAGTFLLGTVEFIGQGLSQYADVPLGFYILVSLALLFFEDRKSIALSGAMAAFAAWTKNEGLLFVAAVLLARYVARRRSGTLSRLAVELRYFASGLAPVLAILALFKFRYAPAPDLSFAQRALDFGRYVTVIEAFLKNGLLLGTFLVPGVLVLAAYVWLVGFRVETRERVGLTTCVVAIAIVLLGDFAGFLLLPNDLNLRIDTSLDRVLMQLWPAALLVVFTATRPARLGAHGAMERKETKKVLRKAAATRRR